MNKYTFILRRDNNIRVNIHADNVTSAWLALEEKIRRMYFEEGVCLSMAAVSWELVQ